MNDNDNENDILNNKSFILDLNNVIPINEKEINNINMLSMNISKSENVQIGKDIKDNSLINSLSLQPENFKEKNNEKEETKNNEKQEKNKEDYENKKSENNEKDGNSKKNSNNKNNKKDDNGKEKPIEGNIENTNIKIENFNLLNKYIFIYIDNILIFQNLKSINFEFVKIIYFILIV